MYHAFYYIHVQVYITLDLLWKFVFYHVMPKKGALTVL